VDLGLVREVEPTDHPRLLGQSVRQFERRQEAVDRLLVGDLGHHHRVREHERVLADQHRQQDARVLGQPVRRQDRVEDLLVVLAVELDPAGVAQCEGVAVVDPDVPRRAEGPVDRHHHDRQPEETGGEHVLGHVSEAVGRRRGESARTGE
jgi:hypothetical protein